VKIYTGRGDNGTAGLFSGERVLKSHDRIEAFGDVDELNSSLGTVRSALPEDQAELINEIKLIQSHLFHVGAWLATSREAPVLSHLQEIREEHVRFLETAIDRIVERLPELNHFILPGGCLAASLAHQSRTVCRRAERHAVRVSVEAQIGRPPKRLKGVLVYLNRLSDYLFVLARYCNFIQNRSDDEWDSGNIISEYIAK
jgi:cob(I)alamin adenosyltransferase